MFTETLKVARELKMKDQLLHKCLNSHSLYNMPTNYLPNVDMTSSNKREQTTLFDSTG